MQSRPLYDGTTGAPKQRTRYGLPHMSNDRYTAIAIWLVGVYFSGAGIQEFGLISNMTYAFIVGFVTQIFLTRFQVAVLQRFSIVGIIALGTDVFLNVGGLYPTLRGLGNTSAWKAFNEALASTGRVAADNPSLLFVLGISVVLAFAIARAPEELWKRNG